MMANFAGLYLGVDFVDLVVLVGSKGGINIVTSVRTPLSPAASGPEQKTKAEALPLDIKKAFDSIKVKLGGVSFGLPQGEAMVRYFIMPYLPEADRHSAVKFEAQKYLPFKVDDTISDFCITEESKGVHKMDALFVAVNKQTMDKYTSLFKAAGIKVNIVDIPAIALARILTKAKRLVEDQTQVVVYLEKDVKGSIIIARDRNVYLARETGLLTSRGAFLEGILNNIRLSVDYFKRETKEVIISEIIICGDGDLSELEIYLKENIGATPITIFHLTNEITGLNDLSKKQLIALGLAMAAFEKPRPKINLLSHATQAALSKGLPGYVVKAGLRQYKPLVIEGVVFFVILVLLQIGGNIRLGVGKKWLAQLKSEKAIIAKGVMPDAAQDELLRMEGEGKLQIEFLKNLVGEKRFFLTKKLNGLGVIMPNGAWIEALQFSDDIGRARTLTINGMIYSQEKTEAAIADRMLSDMKTMEDFHSNFKDIKVDSLEKVLAYNKELLAFSIKCIGQPLNSSGLLAEGSKKDIRWP